MVQKINENEFAKAREAEVAVVDFSAVWCGPCRMLAPIMEELSDEYGSNVSFYNVDVDQCPNLAREFGIVSIPAVAVMKKGNLSEMNVGFVPKEKMKGFIDKNMQ